MVDNVVIEDADGNEVQIDGRLASAFVIATSPTATGIHANDAATKPAMTIGNAPGSAGFAGTGTPPKALGALAIYQKFGDYAGSSNAAIPNTTQAAYLLANYYGPTADDSAEAFSAFVGLKDTGTGFTQTLKTTAFEAIAQVEGSNIADDSTGGYVLGVGSRINAVGASSRIKKAYGFKAATNSSGGPPYGTIDYYAAFAQVVASGATTAYGVYVVDAINGETSLAVGDGSWTGQAKIAKAGNTDSAVSLAVLKGPDSAPGLTELSLVAGTGQTRSILECRDSGGTARVQVTSAGAVNMRGQQISVNDSSGNAQILLQPGTGITFTDARNIVFGTTTGTKIGTGVTQKMGFWNATPVVQPTVTGSRTSGAALTSLLTTLATLGLIVDSTSA